MRRLLGTADIQTCEEVKSRSPEPLQGQRWQIPVFTLKVGVEDIPREKETSYREGSVIAPQTLTSTSFPVMVQAHALAEAGLRLSEEGQKEMAPSPVCPTPAQDGPPAWSSNSGSCVRSSCEQTVFSPCR
ncbi:hypothetical protein NDU88_004034 [Pleurodeles waltl]|uniref:Uncharacterized protein n=1 Tax=Pleurodeles waltl TaxID=8319 RepID=A0AAV7LGY7_PLEWA|nr:hypothetical protein NDU88_004034 [Pleurodeles waltl]